MKFRSRLASLEKKAAPRLHGEALLIDMWARVLREHPELLEETHKLTRERDGVNDENIEADCITQ